MCMMSSNPRGVTADKPVVAPSGKGITNEDPRFTANKMRKKRMNLRIKKPS